VTRFLSKASERLIDAVGGAFMNMLDSGIFPILFLFLWLIKIAIIGGGITLVVLALIKYLGT
jgi:hypothetical protein